jgi:hypothetical protein
MMRLRLEARVGGVQPGLVDGQHLLAVVSTHRPDRHAGRGGGFERSDDGRMHTFAMVRGQGDRQADEAGRSAGAADTRSR